MLSFCLYYFAVQKEEISIIRKADFILTGNFILKCNYWARLAAWVTPEVVCPWRREQEQG